MRQSKYPLTHLRRIKDKLKAFLIAETPFYGNFLFGVSQDGLSEDLREQINSLIRDEIQENINDYVDSVEETKKAGLGFVSADDDKELKVKVSQREIDKIIKEYKKMKKSEKSNLSQIKKLGLVDKNGKPLS